MKNQIKAVTIFTLMLFTTVLSNSCKKETPVNKFLGTYVGTYNIGTDTTNYTYSFVFLSDTDMEVYDGDVATGSKAEGKYSLTGTNFTGYYVYPSAPEDTITLTATMPNANTYTLNGNWTKGPDTGEFTVSKQ
jgi:hypothetical protein